MKAIIVGLALLVAAPVAAQTTPPAPVEKDGCCCKGMKDEKGCCDGMKPGDKPASGNDAHAGHDMSKMHHQ